MKHITAEWLRKLGYLYPRLVDGQWVAMQQMLYTWAVVYGLDEDGKQGRYCYEHRIDAESALAGVHAPIGEGHDPEGPWIKHSDIYAGERRREPFPEGSVA